MTCFGIGFLDREEEQLPRKGAFPDMGALGEPRQPGGVLRAEREVQPIARSLHVNECTSRTSMKRVPTSQQLGAREIVNCPRR